MQAARGAGGEWSGSLQSSFSLHHPRPSGGRLARGGASVAACCCWAGGRACRFEGAAACRPGNPAVQCVRACADRTCLSNLHPRSFRSPSLSIPLPPPPLLTPLLPWSLDSSRHPQELCLSKTLFALPTISSLLSSLSWTPTHITSVSCRPPRPLVS